MCSSLNTGQPGIQAREGLEFYHLGAAAHDVNVHRPDGRAVVRSNQARGDWSVQPEGRIQSKVDSASRMTLFGRPSPATPVLKSTVLITATLSRSKDLRDSRVLGR